MLVLRFHLPTILGALMPLPYKKQPQASVYRKRLSYVVPIPPYLQKYPSYPHNQRICLHNRILSYLRPQHRYTAFGSALRGVYYTYGTIPHIPHADLGERTDGSVMGLRGCRCCEEV